MASAPGGTQAVDRAATLIDLVVHADEPVSFTELCDETGLARSTTSRLLAALERTDLLERHTAGGYVAGPLFALHAALHDPWPQVARLARPVLETIGEQTGETVHLGVARGSSVVHFGQVESTFLLAARDWNQVDAPAHCSSLGKVLYAHGLLPLPAGRLERRTPRTLATRADLEAELRTVRRRGFATVIDELETGLSAIAAPVVGKDGVICAVGISGPTARLSDRVDQFGRLLVAQSRELSMLLGSPTNPPTTRSSARPAHPDSPAQEGVA